MWLERFAAQSGQSTAATPNRSASYSPAPRRSIQLGPSTLLRRPGLPGRSASPSIASLNGSSESLASAAKLSNGSSLRNELAGARSADVPDPLDVLDNLLGPSSSGKQETVNDLNGNHAMFKNISEDIDFEGLSLEEFASAPSPPPTIQESAMVTDVKVIDDFELEKTRFEDLHNSILACDKILDSVESYLTRFRADLASVSSEIETLQDRSVSLNNKLDNRRAAEKILGPEIEAFSVSPAIIRKITEGTVDESWARALDELEKRSKAVDAYLKEGKDIKALQDIRPLLDDASAKAIERIRDYVVAQIKAIRSPSINAQVIQQNSFLRYKDVFAFLARREPRLADEISQAYINTMCWYYLSHFTRYKASLEKLSTHQFDQHDMIAADSNSRKGGKPAVYEAYSIGRRMDILKESNESALPSFAADEDKRSHYLEVTFRNYNLALVDNACAEFSFLTEFFSKQPHQAITRKFHEIFQPTFELGDALNKQLAEQSLDALGVLTCVRLNQHFAFELQRRKIPAVEGYINRTNLLLWPRFQRILDAHCESIRKATTNLTGKPAGSALTLTSTTSAAQTTAPHPLTQRFANFLQGISALSSEAGDDEPVSNSVMRLRNDFEAFLTKLSKGIAETRKRERFLYNNYSLVCTIIAETEGRLADEVKAYYLDKRESLRIGT